MKRGDLNLYSSRSAIAEAAKLAKSNKIKMSNFVRDTRKKWVSLGLHIAYVKTGPCERIGTYYCREGIELLVDYCLRPTRDDAVVVEDETGETETSKEGQNVKPRDDMRADGTKTASMDAAVASQNVHGPPEKALIDIPLESASLSDKLAYYTLVETIKHRVYERELEDKRIDQYMYLEEKRIASRERIELKRIEVAKLDAQSRSITATVEFRKLQGAREAAVYARFVANGKLAAPNKDDVRYFEHFMKEEHRLRKRIRNTINSEDYDEEQAFAAGDEDDDGDDSADDVEDNDEEDAVLRLVQQVAESSEKPESTEIVAVSSKRKRGSPLFISE